MNFLDFLPSILGSLIGFIGFELSTRGLVRYRKPIQVNLKWEWKDINQISIPREDLIQGEILVTDGKDVRSAYISNLGYNETGKRVFGYHKQVITHWGYFPSPPRDEK